MDKDLIQDHRIPDHTHDLQLISAAWTRQRVHLVDTAKHLRPAAAPAHLALGEVVRRRERVLSDLVGTKLKDVEYLVPQDHPNRKRLPPTGSGTGGAQG